MKKRVGPPDFGRSLKDRWPAFFPSARFVMYLGVGVVGTSGHYVLLVVLAELFRVDPKIASVSGFGFGACINYLLNYRYTFKSRRSHRTAAVRFFLVAAAGMGVNYLIMYVAYDLMKVHYLLGQVVATGTVVVLTYVVNRHWSFGVAAANDGELRSQSKDT